MDEILFLVGPTASGKTDVAVSLAKKLNAEIISCDSMQVYKGTAILSQTPTATQKSSILHHMIGILDTAKEFSVADYRETAEKIIQKILKKGKTPLIVGGSGLYVKALIDGLFSSTPKDIRLRNRLEALSKKYGNKYLYDRLKKIDPEVASLIHPNNVRRVIRALEIYQTMGIPMSMLKKNTRGLSSRYSIKIFGLRRERQDLYERINKRVENMFKKGLIKEVKALRRKKLSQTAKAVLGYKEIEGYLDGKYTKSKAEGLLKTNTRRFAKRQITWFKKDPRIIWVDIGENDKTDKIVTRICTDLERISTD